VDLGHLKHLFGRKRHQVRMRFLLLLSVLAVAPFIAGAAAAAISPQEIAAARQTCTRQCNESDKVAVAKCMRACWKNFFDHHQGNKRTVAAPHPAPAAAAAKKTKAIRPKIAPKYAVKAKARSAPKRKGATHPRHPTTKQQRVFVPEQHPRLEGRMGPPSHRSMAALLRTGASSIVVNGGLLVCLLAMSAFLMTN
jgi:hypothetical protein